MKYMMTIAMMLMVSGTQVLAYQGPGSPSYDRAKVEREAMEREVREAREDRMEREARASRAMKDAKEDAIATKQSATERSNKMMKSNQMHKKKVCTDMNGQKFSKGDSGYRACVDAMKK